MSKEPVADAKKPKVTTGKPKPSESVLVEHRLTFAEIDQHAWERGAPERAEEARRAQVEEEYQKGREELIEQFFRCACGGEEFSLRYERREGSPTSGGVIMPTWDMVLVGYECTVCSVQFRDLAKFTTRRDELAAALAEYDKNNKPEWLE